MERAKHILIVDDDREICALLERFLRAQDFCISVAYDGCEMKACLSAAAIDLIVLDVVLPGISGLELCRCVRSRFSVPVILMSALKEKLDETVALQAGADDFLCKPFNPRELLAKIRATLRRAEEQGATVHAPGKPSTASGLRIDRDARQVIGANGTEVTLSEEEFSLLMVLLSRPDKTLSRQHLLEMSCVQEVERLGRSMDGLVNRLCSSFDDSQEQALVKRHEDGGYQLVAAVEYLERRK